jgi:putative glycerol-1-phosphate prenyltransferase
MIISQIIDRKQKGIKGFAVLIDPDKVEEVKDLQELINIAIENNVDYFFVGGSFISRNNIGLVVRKLKDNSHLPVILFPGNYNHIDSHADAILFLSLISGRNAEYLIGQHVIAAPFLRKTSLEILPTGYMLVNDHAKSSAAYVSNTIPIPNDKTEIACATAMAGEMLGMQMIYMDAGSGSECPIPPDMISKVSKSINIPLIIGGGIRTEIDAMHALKAGADIIVVGNGIENSKDLLINISLTVSEYNESLKVH